MKLLVSIGWICFALDAAFIVYLFIAKNAGNDAAGRGVATGYAMVLLPILLLAGGVLWWGAKNNSSFGILTGTALVGLPFIFLGYNAIKRKVADVQYAQLQARDGRFKSPALTEIAKAIDAGDTTKLRALLAEHKPLDYKEVDDAGHTLLGFVVTRATGIFPKQTDTESLKILLESGVPFEVDALNPNGDWVRDLIVSGGDKQNELVEIGLKAGADPNARDRYDQKPAIFGYSIPRSRLELLVKHGANLQVFDNKGWTLLMNAVYFKNWDEASFFLEHDVPVKYTAPDSNTVRTLLDEAVRKAKSYQESPGDGYEAFLAALDAKTKIDK
ncbi:MAG: ankyrin repeat domain-containing protein [Gemmatimonadaceae bacterium]